MRDRRTKRQLAGPWRNIHAAVWMIGLAILFWKGWWWPGILVLVAISTLLEAVLMKAAPHAFVEEPEEPLPSPDGPAPVAAPAPVAPAVEHRPDLLPGNCPRCGGPIRGHEVKWTGVQSADCPYCGANLPVDRAR
jgi:hypothetical protein